VVTGVEAPCCGFAVAQAGAGERVAGRMIKGLTAGPSDQALDLLLLE